ncbi:thioredoxin family protein [Sphingobacterium spiritivorum]|uniref:thioredoxin family protein n=1 Tax=Sphingobacterium spiritivorum TaxID=258 RepID=UPI003DA1E4CD
MKNIRILLFAILVCSVQLGFGQVKSGNEQETYEKPYHPEADARKDIDSLIVKAQKEDKTIIIQAGGNWCIWCLRFNSYIHETPEIRELLNKDVLYYHLNYSQENKNEAVFQKYAPEGGKLGYPFFIVLNKNGQVLNVHDSGSLEAGKGYDKEKVLTFFRKSISR